MQQVFDIEQNRSRQIHKVRKLFPFVLNEKQITYQPLIDLNTFIMKQEHHHDNVEILRNNLNIIFVIIYRIIKQLIKIYQIVNISRLNMQNILLDFSNEALPKIHFINLHESNNLISFDENFQEIKLISIQVLKTHQNQLMKKINEMSDHSSNQELIKQQQKNNLIKEIHYATILSNEFLTLLQTLVYQKEIQQFFQKNKINICFNSPLKQNNDEALQ